MSVLRLLPRFRQAQAELDVFAARESWSAVERDAYQLDRINEIWDSARRLVPFYRRVADEHDLPERFESLADYCQRMPVLEKTTVRDHGAELLSTAAEPGRWHRTGGSTGTPLGIYWDDASHRHVLRSKYRFEQSHGIDIFDKKAFLWGHSGSFAPGLKGLKQRIARPIEDSLRNRLRLSAYDLSDAQLQQHLAAIQRFRPKSLYGYSSAVELLSVVAASQAIEVPDMELAILTAEPADDRLLDAVGSRLGCRAVLEYGATECAFMAGTDPEGTIRVRDDVVFLETLPNEVGSYSIVVTVLCNESFPLLRYAIEDGTSKEKFNPPVGFSVLKDVQGRDNDLLISRSGKRLHAMAIKHALEHWPEIRRFTAVQQSTGCLDVTLESEDRLTSAVQEALRHKFENLLGGYHVEINVVDSMPGNLAGKHRWVINEMTAQHE